MHYAAIRNGRPRSLRIENRVLLRELDRVYESLFMDIVQRGMDAGVVVRRDVRLVAYAVPKASEDLSEGELRKQIARIETVLSEKARAAASQAAPAPAAAGAK